MRCFIAIDLPEEVKNELKRLQSEIRSSTASDLKASFTKDQHLTLKFLGEITPQKAELAKKSLGTCSAKKFTVALDKIGVFPGESYIRVVWVGISPEDEVMKLQKEIDEALQKEFKKEKQFKPHLTLARVKYVVDKKRFLQQLRQIKVKKIKFAVNGFKLIRSTLTGKGPVYDELQIYN